MICGLELRTAGFQAVTVPDLKLRLKTLRKVTA